MVFGMLQVFLDAWRTSWQNILEFPIVLRLFITNMYFSFLCICLKLKNLCSLSMSCVTK